VATTKGKEQKKQKQNILGVSRRSKAPPPFFSQSESRQKAVP